MTDLIDIVAAYIGHTREETLQTSIKAPTAYKRYKIPKKKKNAGLRTIHHPSRQTKALQYSLIETFLNRFRIHNCAAAYRRNVRSPLLRNATLHAKYSYSVRVDFSDFFHSISPSDLFVLAGNNGIELSTEEKNFLEDCLFIKVRGRGKGLAIGAPSSPCVSNIAMFTLDEKITSLAASISGQNIYTRYADDIVFSTNTKGSCQTFYEGLCDLISNTTAPKLDVNRRKTAFGSRASRRVVTGLVIQPDGGISLGRTNKRYIRKLLFDLKNNVLTPKNIAYLSGYLAFSLDVEPDFYNRLALKYGVELLARALRPE